MKKILATEVIPTGMPLYEMRNLFEAKGNFSSLNMTLVSIIPGQRIPETGFSCHDEDEYSYIISGTVDTFSGEEYSTEGGGSASLIPRGEKHWCINNGTEPCVLVCFMVK